MLVTDSDSSSFLCVLWFGISVRKCYDSYLLYKRINNYHVKYRRERSSFNGAGRGKAGSHAQLERRRRYPGWTY